MNASNGSKLRRKSHRQHEGERAVQRRRHVPRGVSEALVDAVHDELPRPFFAFLGRLPFLPIGLTDAQGRPWATLLSGPAITASAGGRWQVRARVNAADPFVRAVLAPASTPTPDAKLFAAVAIDFLHRRRVKLAGAIDSATLDDTGHLTLTLQTNEHMGNCPKYITVRELRPMRRVAETSALGPTLSPAARAVLARASTCFVATRHLDRDPHESDAGFNHRGGPRGFVRSFEQDGRTHLVLPDYSGNRFYQSLGNVESDHVMGLVIPDFESGTLLQVTGRARNLFDDEADRLMPGATLVTEIALDEAYLTTGALDLALVGDERLSPYNPKLRPLATEAPDDRTAVDLEATLVAITVESASPPISTFTFALPAPVEVVPGGHAIFDFSGRVSRGYQHMNDDDPQALNDDLVRTFTVSRLSPDARQIAITVKKAGALSSYLHALRLVPDEPFRLGLKGFGGTFTCFEDGRPIPRMLWIAGGVGITPFLAMYRALRASGEPLPAIELFYSCRGDEVALVRELTDIEVRIFDSTAQTPALTDAAGPRRVFPRRVTAADFERGSDGAAGPLAEDPTVFVCGPASFMADVKTWLEPQVPAGRLRFEDFDF
jgi:uncharacterized protein